MSLFAEWPEWTCPTELPPPSDVLALDTETMDPLLKSHGPGWAFKGKGEVVGVALATPTTSVYYPIAHDESNFHDPRLFWAWVQDYCSKPENTLVMFNAIYDLGWLARNGIKVQCKIADPMTAAALLDENRMSYSLDACSKTWLKEEKVDLRPLAQMLGINNIWERIKRVHPALLSGYAARDARLALDLWTCLRRQLADDGLMSIFQLEMGLIPVLLRMRMRGVRFNRERALLEEEKQKVIERDCVAEIKHITGLTVDLWSSGSVEGALLEAGITPPRTSQGAASITAGWLESLDHDVPRLILKGRRANKLHKTFIHNYFIEHEVDGRIHATFSPLRSDEGGTVTGRFSSSNPTLQNLSARNPESAVAVRGLLEPEEDQLWASSDWSSQEPRLQVHFAAKIHAMDSRMCKGVTDIVQQYITNPRTDFHQWVANITGLTRKKAKDINLGLAYGLGEAKLCAQLGFSTIFDEKKGREVAGPEGRAVLDQYHEGVPFMRDLQRFSTEMAEERGYIKTLLGRKRRFLRKGEQPSKFNRKAFAYKALNALIQGSAADQMKKAMIDCDREGLNILVTLHDELCLSVADEREAQRAADIMNEAVKLEVPMVTDTAIGKNWGEAM